MGKRRGFVFRFLFLTAICGIILLGIHFFLYIYKGGNDNSPISLIRNKTPRTANRVVSVFSNVFGHSQEDGPQQDSRINLKHKIVHLDLKGMPLKIHAYKEIFPFFKQLGVTGILIEYEDMFPYHGKLEAITNKEAYTKNDIRKIQEYAKASQLQIIPLVQTFGHMEFVLKLEPYLDLREVPRYPQVICPTNNRSQPLIKEMIDQLMDLHPDIKYLHIGSDEVYHIGMCPRCQERMAKKRIDEAQLFLQHVKSIAQYVKDTFHIQPLMWDDEFRKLDKKTIEDSGLGKLVELIVWNYREDVYNRLDASMWEKYSKLFKSVWIGTAFKGADKPNSMTANETLYLANHFSWVETMNQNENLVSFKGVFLTGWQRYDHFSVTCELLPSGIPSLVSCMTFLNLSGRTSMEEIFLNATAYLDCGARLNYCNFPGSNIHQEIVQLQMYKDVFKRMQEKNIFLGWAQDINLEFEFSNPSHIEPIYQEVSSIQAELERSQAILQKSLKEIYPQWSVEEWMMTHFQPTFDKVNNLKEALTKIVDKRVFPVRPLQAAGVSSGI